MLNFNVPDQVLRRMLDHIILIGGINTKIQGATVLQISTAILMYQNNLVMYNWLFKYDLSIIYYNQLNANCNYN